MNHRGSPKKFSGKEEDFQQCARKTEAFFAEVIKESEMMLEWASDQPMEITTTAIDLEFLPTDSNEGRGVRNLELILQHMHETLMTRTSQEANDIVANSRKNSLEAWRRLHERYDPTGGGRQRNIHLTIISPGRCSLLELQAGIERWETHVARYEKLKGKTDDEIKRAGLESLVPKELENHLIFNSNRLKTFEDARSEIATYVEEKIGLRNRKPSEASFVNARIPLMLGLSALSCRTKENGHQIRAVGGLRVMQHIFKETAVQASTWANQRRPKASQDERNEDWSFDEWNDDRSFVGWREDCEQTHVTSVSSFSLESSEWV